MWGAIFGFLPFWLGRFFHRTGREILNRQTERHQGTREVASKLLNGTGLNLTARAVIGGALGVGLGFGPQANASNFISRLIILFDRSVTVGHFVELDGNKAGIAR